MENWFKLPVFGVDADRLIQDGRALPELLNIKIPKDYVPFQTATCPAVNKFSTVDRMNNFSFRLAKRVEEIMQAGAVDFFVFCGGMHPEEALPEIQRDADYVSLCTRMEKDSALPSVTLRFCELSAVITGKPQAKTVLAVAFSYYHFWERRLDVSRDIERTMKLIPRHPTDERLSPQTLDQLRKNVRHRLIEGFLK